MVRMDTGNLMKIVRGGENVEVELKASFHSVQEIARIVCSFANTQGGILAIGVRDDGSIEGIKGNLDLVQQKISQSNSTIHPSPMIKVEVHEVENRKIIAVIVHRADSSVFHTAEGVIYVRVGSTVHKLEGQSIVEFLRNRQILLFDEAVEPSASLGDIDAGRVKSYLEMRGKGGHMDSHTLRDFLISRKLATFQPDLKLRSSALLFFSKDPQKFYPHTQIKLVRFDGIQPLKVLAYEDAGGTLPQAIDHSVNFVMRFVPKEFVVEDIRRREIPSLPEGVIREAVINAVAHRDYFNKNEIQTSIFDDRVEITNPGGLPEGMTKELLGALSIQRNPKIYQLLKDYGYMEGIGSGISKIYDLMRQAGLDTPEFVISKDFFRIVLRMKALRGTKESPNLSERQLKALAYLKERGDIKADEYATAAGISLPTALKDLSHLGKKGLLRKVGKYKGAYYTLPGK